MQYTSHYGSPLGGITLASDGRLSRAFGLMARSILLPHLRKNISLIIPCHRGVGTNGSLTGYAGGIDRKIWLLEHEGIDTKGLTRPKHSTAP